jgi:threonyl-tRNA synthetase
VLCGLFRLRQFEQDDGHVFCAEEQVEREIGRFVARARSLYASFGFPAVEVFLSTRPANKLGDDALWDRAERALATAAAAAGLPCEARPGEGAFYGPKIELVLRDRAGRDWQCGTLQLDFVMPSRFGLGYVAADGSKRPLVMLHRALLGSLERFTAILLEHLRGRLPLWLAPEQVRILPIADRHRAWAEEVAAALDDAGVRVGVDADASSLPKRVALARAMKVPVIGVVGDREASERSVAIDGAARPLEEAVRDLVRAIAPPVVVSIEEPYAS